MNAELKQALDVIKRHCDTPKGKSFDEYMQGASLKQRIESITAKFLHYVDNQTLWYRHTQLRKEDPNHFIDHPNRKDIEMSKKQREDCIQALKWLENDVKACIGHLQNK